MNSHIGIIPKAIILNDFLDMDPDSSADVTCLLRECFRKVPACVPFLFVSKRRKTYNATGMSPLVFYFIRGCSRVLRECFRKVPACVSFLFVLKRRKTYNDTGMSPLVFYFVEYVLIHFETLTGVQIGDSHLRRHSALSSSRIPPSPRTSAGAKETFLAFVSLRPDHDCGLWIQKNSTYTGLTFPRLCGDQMRRFKYLMIKKLKRI